MAKPQALLIIISLIFSCLQSYSQVDTAKLRKEIALVLKKYGLKEPLFELKIQSTNQKGGQTAYVINNYNGKNIHVINGNNYGVNGNLNLGIQPRIINKDIIDEFIYYFPDRKTLVCFQSNGFGDAEMNNVKNQIIELLKEKGYTNFDKNFRIIISPLEFPDVVKFTKLQDGSCMFLIPPAL